MALLSQTFDVNDLPEATGDYGPIPDGWYQVIIKSADLRPTKDQTGQYIQVRYDVTGPTHANRVVWGNINIKNRSTQAEEIGRQQLGSLLRAIGLNSVQDTDQLVGQSLSIKVSTRTSEGYEPSNEVRGFKAINGAPLPTVDSEPKAESAPSKAAPPWQKK